MSIVCSGDTVAHFATACATNWPQPSEHCTRCHRLRGTYVLSQLCSTIGENTIRRTLPASVSYHVALEAAPLRKMREAKVAPEGFLAGVGASVLGQAGLLLERLVALVALIRALTRVYPLVILHVGVEKCSVAALGTQAKTLSNLRGFEEWLAGTDTYSSRILVFYADNKPMVVKSMTL